MNDCFKSSENFNCKFIKCNKMSWDDNATLMFYKFSRLWSGFFFLINAGFDAAIY